MKSKSIKLVALAAGLLLAYIISFLIRIGESGNSPKVEVQILDSPNVASKEFKEGQTKADPNLVSESKHLIPGLNLKKYYEIVGRSTEELELDENLVMNRVNLGLDHLQRGILITEAKRMSNLGEAYKNLIRNEVFMESNFPIWGIESDKYYVFSGYPNCDQQTAFRNGYAVKKDDGSVFKWLLQEHE